MLFSRPYLLAPSQIRELNMEGILYRFIERENKSILGNTLLGTLELKKNKKTCGFTLSAVKVISKE